MPADRDRDRGHSGAPGGRPSAGAPLGQDPVPLPARPPAGGSRTEVLEAGAREPRRPGRWARWSAARRRVLAVAVGTGACAALVASGAVPVAAWLEGRDVEPVDLRASVGFSARSSPPPGGTISFFLAVRNVGGAPVTVLAATAAHRQIALRSRGEVVRRIGTGEEVRVPVSARLTCAGRDAAVAPSEGGTDAEDPAPVTVALDVRRDDGSPGSTTTPLDAGPLDDVAAAACAARPGLRDVELSGPVLRARADGTVG